MRYASEKLEEKQENKKLNSINSKNKKKRNSSWGIYVTGKFNCLKDFSAFFACVCIKLNHLASKNGIIMVLKP